MSDDEDDDDHSASWGDDDTEREGSSIARPRRFSTQYNDDEKKEKSISQRKRKRSATMRPVKYREVDDNAEFFATDEPLEPVVLPGRRLERRRFDAHDDEKGEKGDSEMQPPKAKHREGKAKSRTTTTTVADDDDVVVVPDGDDQNDLQGPAANKVAMQYLSKKKKVKQYYFDNVASASRKIGVHDHLLEGVCQDGGGFIGGSWFCYHDERDSAKKSKGFFRPQVFDVSKLKRLKGEYEYGLGGRRWKRVIELICKKSGNALVSFPSVEYAAASLGIRMHQVKRACNSYETGQQYDFHSFMLRFTKEPSTYVYGSSTKDFEKIVESHEERMERWNNPTAPGIVHEETQAIETETLGLQPDAVIDQIDPPPPPPAKRPPSPPRETVLRQKTLDDPPPAKRPPSPRETVLRETLDLFGNHFEHTPRSGFDIKAARLCIFCQETSPGIIFEPCGHCIICESCANWSSRTFCPRCRCVISKRKRSTSMFRGTKLDLALKPLTFAPHTFMDIS
jgi:hypothetical protein